MRPVSILLLLSVLFCVAPAAVRAQTESQNQQFANALVGNVLHAKTGDIVVIYADSSHMPLVEHIVTQLRKVGAHAIADIGSNRETKMYFQNVPKRFDSQPPNDAVELARIATSIVTIDYPNDPSVFDGVPATRVTETNKAFLPYVTYILKHNKPIVTVGNGLMPSAPTAQQFGVSLAQLSTLFWSGVNADYAQIHAMRCA